MNKTLLAVIGAAAIAGGAYYLNQDSAGQTFQADLAELAYVPNDSAFFWGQLQPFAYQQYMDLLPDAMKSNEDITLVVDELKKAGDKNALFLALILEKYTESTQSGQKMSEIWGIGDEVKALGYSVGLLPVIRYEVTSPTAFATTMKQAADEAKISYTDETKGDVSLTRFQIEIDGQSGFELIASVKGQWASLTINTPFNSESDLNLALAIEKPAKSLAQSNKLNNYIKDYDFDGQSIAYLNHVAIVDAITAKADSRLKTMLDNVLNASGSQQVLASVRNEQCQADFSDIANKWPATISGTKTIEMNANKAYFEMDTVVASSDISLMNVLASIRGFVPAHTQNANDKMLSVAYGVDVAKVSPMLNNIWTGFTEAEFNCEHLVALQAQAKQNNPMAVAMMTGMAGTLKGMSFSLQNVALNKDDQGQPKIDGLDAILTVSADDAYSLFNSVKGFAGPLAGVDLPSDGTAVVINDMIPSPIPFDGEIKMALKGQHIAVFIGDKSEQIAANLKAEKVAQNGFSNFAMDFQSLVAPMMSAMELSGEPLPQELEQFKNQNMSIYFSADFAEKGIVFETDMTIKKL